MKKIDELCKRFTTNGTPFLCLPDPSRRAARAEANGWPLVLWIVLIDWDNFYRSMLHGTTLLIYPQPSKSRYLSTLPAERRLPQRTELRPFT